MTDAIGAYGGILTYAMIFATMGSALLAFIFFWKNKRLDFDESPKYQLFEDENDHE